MKGQFILTIAHNLLLPAHWVAGQIGLPNHLPVVELGIGLVFLATCFGLAMHALYHWLRSKQALAFIATWVSIIGGIIGLLATVSFSHAWLYTLILTIVTADIYWRLLTKNNLPKQIRRAGTIWAIAALLLCAGTPTLFLVHTWFSEHKTEGTLRNQLTAEQAYLTKTEQAHVAASLTKLSNSPELTDLTFAVGDPLLVATIQRLAASEKIPYLLVLNAAHVVLARSQPVAAFGDTWPVSVTLGDIPATGFILSERNQPILIGTHTITSAGSQYVLVGGVQVDQSYLSERSATIKAPLFLVSGQGITALAAPEGNALNALSASSVDTFLAARSGRSGSFSIASGNRRYIAQTLPLTSASGSTVATLGIAQEDTAVDFRIRFDLVVMIAFAILILVLPAVVWKRKEQV